MNLIEYYKEKSLSIEGQYQIDMIRGCILESGLDNQDKREMLDFMTALEEYLEDDNTNFQKCIVCDELVNSDMHYYCPACGNKIDWSKD